MMMAPRTFPGDWVSYPDMVLLAGGNPVIVESLAKNNFKINIHCLVVVLHFHILPFLVSWFVCVHFTVKVRSSLAINCNCL